MKIPKQLTSRKFWLAVAAFLTSLSGFIVSLTNGDLNHAQDFLHAMLVSVGLYTAVEGASDVVSRHKQIKAENEAVKAAEAEDEDIDRNTIETGKEV